MLTDQCVKDCSDTNINVHALAFSVLADQALGHVAVQYQVVSVEPAGGPCCGWCDRLTVLCCPPGGLPAAGKHRGRDKRLEDV
jgi:hypothetical protein